MITYLLILTAPETAPVLPVVDAPATIAAVLRAARVNTWAAWVYVDRCPDIVRAAVAHPLCVTVYAPATGPNWYHSGVAALQRAAPFINARDEQLYAAQREDEIRTHLLEHLYVRAGVGGPWGYRTPPVGPIDIDDAYLDTLGGE